MEEIKHGIIYCIKSPSCVSVYIGSTTKTLEKRFYYHKKAFKDYSNGKNNYTSSFEIVQYDDSYIELIRNVECTKQQMHEQEYQEIKKT